MEIKNQRLPPLPRKNPIQIELNSNKPSVPQPRITSYSRQKFRNPTIESRPVSEDKKFRRPTSVRQRSADSMRERSSVGKSSRQSSGQKYLNEPTLVRKKSSVHYNVKMRLSMPTVSAQSWAVFELKQGKFIYGKRIFKKREIASLTKMMNLITMLELLQSYQLQSYKIKIKVSKEAACIIGTTAQLKPGIELSVEELLYGMMLPSGNDAAYQLAEVGGALLQMQRNSGYIDKGIVYNVEEMTKFYIQQQFRIKNYLAQMNRLSKRIQMKNSNFANTHGLSNPDNYSCAEDLGKLCAYAMKNIKFRQVVSTQVYETAFQPPILWRNQPILDEEDDCILKWENTNKMLKEGWSGIKTGITPNAGPCLAASVLKHLSGRDLEFLVVLINSKSMQARWGEVREIVDWVISQQIYF